MEKRSAMVKWAEGSGKEVMQAGGKSVLGTIYSRVKSQRAARHLYPCR